MSPKSSMDVSANSILPNGNVRIHGEFWRVTGLSDVAAFEREVEVATDRAIKSWVTSLCCMGMTHVGRSEWLGSAE